MSKPPKINVTTNYKLFHRDADNRALDVKKHRALKESMEQNGFIPDYHIICTRGEDGLLRIKDGQHRFHFAQMLGLPVYWTETNSDFDVAVVNAAQKGWLPMDYATRFSAGGNQDYAELLEFKEDHGIPLTIAAMLLSGMTTFTNVAQKFYCGEFKVTDRAWAKSVVAVYTPLVQTRPALKTRVFLLACMAVARVKGFNAKRLAENLTRCQGKIALYANRDEYLEMLESIYNFGRKDIVGLKIEAVKVMRDRNPKHRRKDIDAPPEA